MEEAKLAGVQLGDDLQLVDAQRDVVLHAAARLRRRRHNAVIRSYNLCLSPKIGHVVLEIVWTSVEFINKKN